MNLSSAQFRRAAALQEKIEAMQADLASLLSGSPASPGKAKKDNDKPAKKKRTMSASARKRIAEAQRARWAKQKAATAAAEKKGK
ncbi:MAG TPA: hypothetical protein DDZ88_14020 [Verrucomicrobiales bacterium]|nr:hypothetical protein [Verrucomicrobiales bacterium]